MAFKMRLPKREEISSIPTFTSKRQTQPISNVCHNYNLSVTSSEYQKVGILYEPIYAIKSIRIFAQGHGVIRLKSPHMNVSCSVDTDELSLFVLTPTNHIQEDYEMISVITKPEERLEIALIQVDLQN